MKKVAVFGNAGGGKSTPAKRLSEISGLPLYSLDLSSAKAAIGRERKMVAGFPMEIPSRYIRECSPRIAG